MIRGRRCPEDGLLLLAGQLWTAATEMRGFGRRTRTSGEGGGEFVEGGMLAGGLGNADAALLFRDARG